MRSLILVIVMTCAGCLPCEGSCSDYNSQDDAQCDLDKDAEKCAALDSADDDVACNESGNAVTQCATTAACGCSNLNKAECGGACCTWTVGCGCRSSAGTCG